MPAISARAACLCLSLCALLAGPGAAQHAASAASPLVRAVDGSPGVAYWQQRVDYRLEASLEPASRTLRGSGWITYHNRSPHRLDELHWHLYQNLFRDDAPGRAGLWSVGSRIATTRGITLQRLEADGEALAQRIDGTRMRTPLPRPLASGDSLRIRVEWEYEVPPIPDLRTGARDGAFGMAQWYPQVAVYDDVHGWDPTPYLGRGEFYLEYGDWDVRLTVPGDYVVAATGTLLNPREVLTAAQAARLAAASADTVRPVIPYQETGDARRSLAGSPRTWHFGAGSVRDFAWAAAPDLVWDATRASGSGTLVQAFYRASEAHEWAGGAAHARRAMERLSERVGPYAYPQATVVSGPVRGMEYPMLVFADRGAAEDLIVHELAHQWFPMQVGSHEARHPFMDEGMATFLASLVLDDPRRAEGPAGDRLAMREFERMYAGLLGARPVAQHADQGRGGALGYYATAYLRGSAVLFMLRDLLGPDVMDEGLREFHRRWRFRHPYPDDLRRTLEDVAGRDLGWFWEQWVRGAESLDFAVDAVRQRRAGEGWRAEIDLVSRARGTMAATVRLTLADGSRRDLRVPPEAWSPDAVHTRVVDALPARVVRVEVDPEGILPDASEANDRWPAPVTLLAERGRIRREVGAGLLLDDRALSWHPALGWNEVDGTELGVVSLHRVGPSEGRLQTMLRLGTRSLRPDLWLGYEAALPWLGPTAAWGAQAMQIDGRVGADLEVQVARRPPGRRTDPTVVDRRLWLGLHTVGVRDARYVEGADDWEDGWLTAGTARMRVPRPGWWGEGHTALEVELGLPVSDWSYAKLGAEAGTRLPLAEGVALSLRSFAGASLGDLPAQTGWSLAQATAWERFARHRHVRGRGGNTRLVGGGGVAGLAPGDSHDRLLAADLALEGRRGWLLGELFADAAAPGFGALVDRDRWGADAGLGVGVRLPGGGGFRVRLPLWVRDPAYPDRDPWNLRWRILIGD